MQSALQRKTLCRIYGIIGAKKPAIKGQKLAQGRDRYVQIQQWTISLADFRQPVGMHLKEDNRRVKKAQTIPWSEIEQRYAALFTNRKGNVAKPLRLALGACIIQADYGFSDEEPLRRFRRIRTIFSSAAA